MAGFPDHHSTHHALMPSDSDPAGLYAPVFSRQDGQLSRTFLPAAHLSEYGGGRFQE